MQQLFDAIYSDDAKQIRELLTNHPKEVNTVIYNHAAHKKQPPLVIAAEGGKLEAYKALMEFNPDVEAVDKEDNTTVFQEAAYNARNYCDKDITPEKSKNCHVIALLLLERNRLIQNGQISGKLADINRPSHTKKTPLHYAAQNNNKELAEILITLGADPTLQDYKKKCPSEVAASEKHDQLACFLRVASLKTDVKKGVIQFGIDRENGEILIVFKETACAKATRAWDAIINQLKSIAINEELGFAADKITPCTGTIRGQRADTEVPKRSLYVAQEFKGQDNAYENHAVLRVIIKKEYRSESIIYDTVEKTLRDELSIIQFDYTLSSFVVLTEEKNLQNILALEALKKEWADCKMSVGNFEVATCNDVSIYKHVPIYSENPFDINLAKIPLPEQPNRTLRDKLLESCKPWSIQVDSAQDFVANAQVIVPILPGFYSSDFADSISQPPEHTYADYVGAWHTNSPNSEYYLTLAISTDADKTSSTPFLEGAVFSRVSGHKKSTICGQVAKQETNFRAHELPKEVLSTLENNNDALEAAQLNGTIMLVVPVTFTPRIYSSTKRGGESLSAYTTVGTGGSGSTQQTTVAEIGDYELNFKAAKFFWVQPTIINTKGVCDNLPSFTDKMKTEIKAKHDRTQSLLQQRYGVTTQNNTKEVTYSDFAKAKEALFRLVISNSDTSVKPSQQQSDTAKPIVTLQHN